jgi:hypothetical protein
MVTALDASNNAVASYSGTVHFSSSDSQAMLPGNSKLTNGTGTFSATLESTGAQTITATDMVTASITGTSNLISVSGPATHTSVTAPGGAIAGTAISVTVSALDASNNTVPGYSGTVHLTSTDPQALLPADSMLMSGSRTFSVTLNTAGSQTVAATDTVTPSITGTSNSISVTVPAGNMKFLRAGHAATLLMNGTVLITGGENTTGPLAAAELFEPSTGTFISTGSLGTARVGHTATLLGDGRVLVTGGNDATGALATAEIFDPPSGTFTPTGSMGTARVGHTATLLNDGEVLVAGGGSAPVVLFGPVTGGGTASTELFDPKSGQFSPAGNMTVSRIYHSATLLPNGEVLMAGGTDVEPNSDAFGDLFSPETGTFTATATGGTTALHLAAALLEDGSVLLAGGELGASPCGEGGSLVSTKSALVFNSDDANFSETGDMSASRVSHTATLLPGGEILIAGGATSQTKCNRGFGTSTFQSVASAEHFNPDAGTFAPIANMLAARAGHTATLLGNGKVLVVGGVDANGNFLATSELLQ